MKVGSICTGVATECLAWHPLGWRSQWFAENDPFCCALLKQRYPKIPNYGDVLEMDFERCKPIDILVAGTPCQSFSAAGRGEGLDDPRGRLSLRFCEIVDATRPRWFVWENVPRVLSNDGGRAFGAIIGAMDELGYSLAWRILDSQNWGVSQRRRRVFVVGYSGGTWQHPAAVLFERHCLQMDTSQGKTQETKFKSGPPSGAFNWREDDFSLKHYSPCLGELDDIAIVGTLTTMDGGPNVGESATYIPSAAGVRRLMPIEFERLQGFPDNYSLVDYRGGPAKDRPRYRAIGKAITVPVLEWIGERI